MHSSPDLCEADGVNSVCEADQNRQCCFMLSHCIVVFKCFASLPTLVNIFLFENNLVHNSIMLVCLRHLCFENKMTSRTCLLYYSNQSWYVYDSDMQ